MELFTARRVGGAKESGSVEAAEVSDAQPSIGATLQSRRTKVAAYQKEVIIAATQSKVHETACSDAKGKRTTRHINVGCVCTKVPKEQDPSTAWSHDEP